MSKEYKKIVDPVSNKEYYFSQPWFFTSELKQNIGKFIQPDPSKCFKILEIGCFEGLASIFFANNFLEHPESRLVCVDPFLTIENNDHASIMNNNCEQIFRHNIASTRHPEKIQFKRVTSDEFFEHFERGMTEYFDFIYVDGNHLPPFIWRDLINAFRWLRNGGIMWMDDYKLNGETTRVMDDFLELFKGKYEIIHQRYQLAIRKTMLNVKTV